MSDERRERPLLVWAIIASQFAPPFMFSGVTVALPRMGAELRASALQLGLVETLFLAGSLAALLPMARLADAGDKRSAFKLGLLGFVACTIGVGLARGMAVVLVLRVVQGVMSAMFASTGPAILSEIVPPERRGRAFGASIGAAYAGLTLGPMAAGVLVDGWGWRAVFAGGALVLAATLAVVHVNLPSRWRTPPRGTLQAGGVIAWVSGVSLAVLSSATLRHGWPGVLALAAAAAVFAGFVRAEARNARPLLDVALLRSRRALASALLVQLLLYMMAFASVFLLSVFMQVGLGHSAERAGQVIAAGTVLMAVTAPLSGVLADRLRPRVVSVTGVALVAIATALATRLGPASSLGAVFAVVTVQGLGFALFSTPNMKVIMGAVDAAQSGMASALGATARSLGMVTGMLLVGALLAVRLGAASVEADPQGLIEVMQVAYRILAAVVGLALVAALRG